MSLFELDSKLVSLFELDSKLVSLFELATCSLVNTGRAIVGKPITFPKMKKLMHTASELAIWKKNQTGL